MRREFCFILAAILLVKITLITPIYKRTLNVIQIIDKMFFIS